MNAAQDFNGIQPDGGTQKAVIAPAIPEPLHKLPKEQKAIWDHITQSLYEYGLIHKTDAIVISVITRTYAAWVKAEEHLDKIIKTSPDGSYMVQTPNGFSQPHQAYYVAQKLKKELLSWLPEAALTIPSFQKAVGDISAPNQAALFDDDPVEKHRKNKTKIGMVAINGGKVS